MQDLPPHIRVTSLGLDRLHVACLQCGAQHETFYGPQARLWASQHDCFALTLVPAGDE